MIKRNTVFILLIFFLMLGCSQNKFLKQSQIEKIIKKVTSMPLEPVEQNEVAVLETNWGTMVLEFYPDKAPDHCSAFKRLVKAGYYDYTTFHRVVKDFMIQGGDIATRDSDPKNDGNGPNPGYTLNAEFNDIPHDKGVLSMAREKNINSAGSQFFICLTRERTKHLDRRYTAFGKLIKGFDVLEKIGSTPVKMSPVFEDKVLPVEPIYIKKAYMKKLK